jgi:hypothetical protein
MTPKETSKYIEAQGAYDFIRKRGPSKKNEKEYNFISCMC